ncbi:unnamed protein product [Allacma fusca]|uniref:MYND-type domain-containing protein n=1 Tax=Allacma fusca TaxID=39272 RepID=A0A8J2P1X8_9HEXA|nr:unnamed protein product [Allacma fusca]
MNYSMGYAGNNYSHSPGSGVGGHYHGHAQPHQQDSQNYDPHRIGDTHESNWPLRCNNCGNVAEIFCPRCENVGYCSEAHLLEDEMNHKANCMPEQNFTEVNRMPDSHQVHSISSSNNLNAGETVAKIRPIMMAPHDKNQPGPANSSLCFGCSKWYPTGSYQCSMCGWPVCSMHCEANSLHSTYECEIFHLVNVPGSMFPGIYDIVLTLRCIIMLRNSNDESPIRQSFRDWNSFKSNVKNLPHLPPVPGQLQSVAENFLSKICHLNFNLDKSCSPEFIQQVLTFVHANSLCQENKASPYDSNHIRNYHSVKYVIPYKFAYGQSCNPNTHWTINYAPSLRESNLHIWATNILKIGDALTACFNQIFPELGTHERRNLHMLHFQRKCECPRCKDPKELNSYASAVKCKNCSDGLLLPLNPLEDGSIWKCENASCGQEMEPQVVFNRFHEIIEDIHELKLRTVWWNWGAARICLDFADAVSPGLTKHRAKYIFMLQMVHGLAETHNAVYHFGKDEFVEGRLIRQKFDKIYLYQQEFYKIAQLEKPGSCLHSWLETLAKSKDDLSELLRTTAQWRAFNGYELERLKRAFSYYTSEVYEPNLPRDLCVDVSHIVFYIDPAPFRFEYKTFFGF